MCEIINKFIGKIENKQSALTVRYYLQFKSVFILLGAWLLFQICSCLRQKFTDDTIYVYKDIYMDGREAKKLPNVRSSVRFLESSSGTFTTEFLWFTSSWITGEEIFVILQKKVFELSLGWLVLKSLCICDDTLGDGHSDCHALCHGTSTSYSNSNCEVLESICSEDENWLVNLGSHRLWFNKMNWFSVDSKNTCSLLAKSNRGCVLLLSESSNLLQIVTHNFLDMMHKLNVLIT